jgi:SAM-dependent methyltransferase
MHPVPALSEAVCRTIAESVGLRPDDPRQPVPAPLAAAVQGLSLGFTRDGPLPADYLDDDAARRAYLAYFLPVNVAKIQSLLREMPVPSSERMNREGRFRVLDLGCGPGTGALAVLDRAASVSAQAGVEVEIVAIDRSAQALHDCERLLGRHRRTHANKRATMHAVQGRLPKDLSKVGQNTFDLIIAANLLNEMLRDHSQPVSTLSLLLTACASLLAEDGTLLVLDPALRETARTLHHVRDALLGHPAAPFTVYSPCLHHRACPALVKPTDWCHEERPWTPPAFVAAIDREVGFVKDALKFSYLLLRKDGRTIVPREPDCYRVVSELREMKGEKRAWLCHEGGRPEVGRLNRERSEANAAVEVWHRGAIVRVSEIVWKERRGREATVGRIGKESSVEMMRPV